MTRSSFARARSAAAVILCGSVLLAPSTGPDSIDRDFGGTWMIDLVGIRHHKHLPVDQRVKNLARLNASFHDSTSLTRTDRLSSDAVVALRCARV